MIIYAISFQIFESSFKNFLNQRHLKNTLYEPLHEYRQSMNNL